MHLKTLREKITFLLILALAIALRIYGQNWDSGFHLHPDERMLIMVTTRIHFFTNLNPEFFNYGSLPIYILAALAQFFESVFKIPIFNYTGLLFLGRTLSTIFDIFTLFVVFKIARRLFNTTAAFFALFVYAVAFFPIQNAHFFVVDPFVTFLLATTVYSLLRHMQTPTKRSLLLTALFYAMALATKASALVVYPVVILGLLLPYYRQALLRDKSKNRVRILFSTTVQQLGNVALFHFSLFFFHFIFMPYTYIHLQQFIQDISLQMRMNTNAYIFPYTLQYVGTMPYIYYLKNIFLWGMGPIFSLLTIWGCMTLIKSKTKNVLPLLLFLAFYVLYFLVLGKSAVKFMRYMLPLYPFFAVFAGVTLSRIFNSQLEILNSKLFMRFAALALCLFGFAYTLMFMHIYAKPNTRLQATSWIVKHIPPRSTIAIEHWDDQVPLGAPPEYYNFVLLPLYNQPDGEAKWKTINDMLNSADYIVIASNRLYVPITHLVDCDRYAVCFPLASKYYTDLFSEKRGFEKVKEFSENPQFTIGSLKLQLNDQGADESFTVYDHPKILIFKKK
ncbi:MAG: glycosyltransferase family 39 protein [Candidatus Roizmanbacteria bacterium]|nr:glycosyltransferase family 39 protein [Candidatus Roizmanbacteria bacterium]